jgi:glucose-6-phosphate isomerase
LKTNNYYQQNVKNLPSLDSKVLLPYLDQIRTAHKKIILDIKSNQIAPLNIISRINDIELIQNLATKINQQFKNIIVLAVGGSSLGGRTLTAIAKKSANKIVFMESIDKKTIAHNLDNADLQNTLFLVISKSGETIETICQTLIVIEKFKLCGIKNFNKNFIFITQNQKNSIAKIGSKIGSKIYLHPEDVGGRFSYLTIVGLLPAAICGLNILEIIRGAKQILDDFVNLPIEQNYITRVATYQLYLFDRGIKNNVLMPYIDSLKDFTDWYRQLFAESLGKNGFGITPINSMGTIDQHSQLQLYLDGPKDKFFTFILNKDIQNNLMVVDLIDYKTLFGGKNLGKILQAEQKSTIEMLNCKQLPIRILELETFDEKNLSALMMQMFLEVILIAGTKNINPFDQPAVEIRKVLSKEYLTD